MSSFNNAAQLARRRVISPLKNNQGARYQALAAQRQSHQTAAVQQQTNSTSTPRRSFYQEVSGQTTESARASRQRQLAEIAQKRAVVRQHQVDVAGDITGERQKQFENKVSSYQSNVTSFNQKVQTFEADVAKLNELKKSSNPNDKLAQQTLSSDLQQRSVKLETEYRALQAEEADVKQSEKHLYSTGIYAGLGYEQFKNPSSPVQTMATYPFYTLMKEKADWLEDNFVSYIAKTPATDVHPAVTSLATGVSRVPGFIVEMVGMGPLGLERTAHTPENIPGYLLYGLGLQAQTIYQGASQRPIEFTGEMGGFILATKGAGKAYGALPYRIGAGSAEFPNYRYRSIDLLVTKGKQVKSYPLVTYGKSVELGTGASGTTRFFITPNVKARIGTADFPNSKARSLELVHSRGIVDTSYPLLTYTKSAGTSQLNLGTPRLSLDSLVGTKLKEGYSPTTPLETRIITRNAGKEGESVELIRDIIADTQYARLTLNEFKSHAIDVLESKNIPNSHKVADAIVSTMDEHYAYSKSSFTQYGIGKETGFPGLDRIPGDFDVLVHDPGKFNTELTSRINTAAGSKIVETDLKKVYISKTGEELFDTHKKGMFEDVHNDIVTDQGIKFHSLKGKYNAWGIKPENLVNVEGTNIFLTTLSEQATRKLQGGYKVFGKPVEYSSNKGANINLRGQIMPAHEGRVKDWGDFYFIGRSSAEAMKLSPKLAKRGERALDNLEQLREGFGPNLGSTVKGNYETRLREMEGIPKTFEYKGVVWQISNSIRSLENSITVSDRQIGLGSRSLTRGTPERSFFDLVGNPENTPYSPLTPLEARIIKKNAPIKKIPESAVFKFNKNIAQDYIEFSNRVMPQESYFFEVSKGGYPEHLTLIGRKGNIIHNYIGGPDSVGGPWYQQRFAKYTTHSHPGQEYSTFSFMDMISSLKFGEKRSRIVYGDNLKQVEWPKMSRSTRKEAIREFENAQTAFEYYQLEGFFDGMRDAEINQRVGRVVDKITEDFGGKIQTFHKSQLQEINPYDTKIIKETPITEAEPLINALEARKDLQYSNLSLEEFRPHAEAMLESKGIKNPEKVADAIIESLREQEGELSGSFISWGIGKEVGSPGLNRIPADYDVAVNVPEVFNKIVVERMNKAAGEEFSYVTSEGKVGMKSGDKLFDTHSKTEDPFDEFTRVTDTEYLSYGIKPGKLSKTKEGVQTITLSDQATKKLHGGFKIFGKPVEYFSEEFGIKIKGQIMPTHEGRIKDWGDFYFVEKLAAAQMQKSFNPIRRFRGRRGERSVERYLDALGEVPARSIRQSYQAELEKGYVPLRFVSDPKSHSPLFDLKPGSLTPGLSAITGPRSAVYSETIKPSEYSITSKTSGYLSYSKPLDFSVFTRSGRHSYSGSSRDSISSKTSGAISYFLPVKSSFLSQSSGRSSYSQMSKFSGFSRFSGFSSLFKPIDYSGSSRPSSYSPYSQVSSYSLYSQPSGYSTSLQIPSIFQPVPETSIPAMTRNFDFNPSRNRSRSKNKNWDFIELFPLMDFTKLGSF